VGPEWLGMSGCECQPDRAKPVINGGPSPKNWLIAGRDRLPTGDFSHLKI